MADTEGLRLFFALALGTLALVVMAVAIIAFVLIHQRRVIAHQLEIKKKDEVMQKELLRATIQSQEEEQHRIGRDLHDDLGPMLSAVKLKISQLGRQLNGEPDSLAELAESKEMLDITINQVRGIAHRLMPPLLEDYGLASAIESSCQKMTSELLQIEVKFQTEYIRMGRETELALYRVIMELLNNVVKHSKATRAFVSFMQNKDGFEIKVSDNGIGFDAKAQNQNTGLGLRNIQSRLTAINAFILYQSSPGSTVAVIMPQPGKILNLLIGCIPNCRFAQKARILVKTNPYDSQKRVFKIGGSQI